MDAQGKVIVVSGANRGIGHEIVRQLAAHGAAVWLTARDARQGQPAADALAATGLAVRFQALDVASPESCAALAAALQAGPGRVDVLVNNAGIMHGGHPGGGAAQTSAAEVMTVFHTNTLGALQLTQALLPLLRASRDARVVNLSSSMGSLADMQGGWAAYRLSKAALNALTRMLADELGPGIVVNSMCPGWVRSDMGGAAAPRSLEQGADTAVWLALEAPRRLTGRFLRDRAEIPW